MRAQAGGKGLLIRVICDHQRMSSVMTRRSWCRCGGRRGARRCPARG